MVIILDSITRLARALQLHGRGGSGRTLSRRARLRTFAGEAEAIPGQRAQDRAGRRVADRVTIIGTALVDTGSRMDQVIFEEFKGTGNSELTLSRDLADRRIFPAIDLAASATRKEELLLADDALTMSRAMRRQLSDVSPADGMDELLRVMRQTKTNQELIDRALERL